MRSERLISIFRSASGELPAPVCSHTLRISALSPCPSLRWQKKWLYTFGVLQNYAQPSASVSITLSASLTRLNQKVKRSSGRTPHETVRFLHVLWVLLLFCLYSAHNQAAPPPRHSDPLRQAAHAPGAPPTSRIPAERAHAQARAAAQNHGHLHSQAEGEAAAAAGQLRSWTLCSVLGP